MVIMDFSHDFTPHPIDSKKENDSIEVVPAKTWKNLTFKRIFWACAIRNVGGNPGCWVDNVEWFRRRSQKYLGFLLTIERFDVPRWVWVNAWDVLPGRMDGLDPFT